MLVLAGAGALFATAAMAEDVSGLVTRIDRLNGTIAIQQSQSGTVGASASPTREFKVQETGSLEDLHAGDRVSFTANDVKGVKTITNLKRQ
jgi:Cu/Ag efflux protein CusF